MHVVTLNGWGRPAESLNLGLPNTQHLDYAPYDSAETFLDATRSQPPSCDILVGWSLGGQLASRLIAERIFTPSLLILFAPAYQYVSGNGITCGVNPIVFRAFSQAFTLAPKKVLKEFALRIAEEDDHAQEIIKELTQNEVNTENWQRWLSILGNYSCADLDFSHFPRTLIIHGKNDHITNPQQSTLFADAIPHSRLELFSKCGHAPHLHDPARVKQLIEEEWEACATHA